MSNYPTIRRGSVSLTADASCSDCDECSGLGSVYTEEGGYAVAARCPSCFEKRKSRSRFNAAQLPNVCHGMTFTGFFPASHSQKTALEVSRSFCVAAKTGSTRKGVALLGSPGVGKTHLLSSIAHYLTLVCGRSVRWARFDRLTAQIRSQFGGGGNPEADAVEFLCSAEITLIDELGKGRGSDYEQSVADAVITELHDRQQPLVVASNYLPPGVGGGAPLIERIGPRAWSRLSEICAIIPMDGKDARVHPIRQNAQ